MSFAGTFVNGKVEFDEPPPLAEGTVVDVVTRPPAPLKTQSEPTLLSLLKLAGTAKDMPADFAEEHDHYIHGTPRRKPKVEG